MTNLQGAESIMINFLWKWLLNGAIVVLLMMWFADVNFWTAAVTATVLTVIAYFIGDQMILRMSNNIVATIMDAVLALVYFLIVEYMFDFGLNFGEMVTISIVLGIAEWFFHRYFLRDDGARAAAGREKAR
jgi:hypothetical protein